MAMTLDKGSVTRWISDVRLGHDEAAQRLWDRYSDRLVTLVRERLGSHRITVADELDITNETLGAFFLQIRDGAFQDLNDRDGLWRLLATIAYRKSKTLIRHEHRGKRDLRRRHDPESIDAVGSSTERPDVIVLCAEFVSHFLVHLQDDTFRAIALARMEGRTNAEIAEHVGYSVPTIERKLRLIRQMGETLYEEEEGIG